MVPLVTRIRPPDEEAHRATDGRKMQALRIQSTYKDDPAGSVGFIALYAYMFIIFSAGLDLVPGMRVIRPSLLLAVFGLLAVGISGQFAVLTQHRITRILIALTIWFVLCIPFSIWPGGAARTLVTEWNVGLLSFFLPAGLLWNHKQCRKIANLIGFSGLVLALLALKINAQSTDGGRLRLPNTRYANSNDLAMMMLIILPFAVVMGMRFGGLRRLVAITAVPAMLLVIAKSGSRAALIALVLCLVVVFWQVSMAKRAGLVAVAIVGLMAMSVVVPDTLARRFLTMFGDDDVVSGSVEESTIASAYSRRTVLLDSIELTLRRPIFGVGPGNFPVAQNEMDQARGKAKGLWKVTHNTYTQLSSETGLPGLFLHLTAVLYCFRSLSKTRKTGNPNSPAFADLHSIAAAMQVSLVALLTCSFFSSVGYNLFFTVLAGFAVGIENCAVNLANSGRPLLPAMKNLRAARPRLQPAIPSMRPIMPQKA